MEIFLSPDYIYIMQAPDLSFDYQGIHFNKHIANH